MIESTFIPRRQVLPGLAMGVIAASGIASAQNSDPIAEFKALFASYQKAFDAQDMAGILKLFAPDAVIVGTGPGEIWGGTAEITTAYKHFFELFDKGKQHQESLFRDGGVVGDMAWYISLSKVSFTKGAKSVDFGLNTSVVFQKIGGKWQVRAMHFSNVQTAPKQG
jgi:uncharacterized protein (TIGR02246 family)